MAITTVDRVAEFRSLTPEGKARAEKRLAAAETWFVGELGYDPLQVTGTVRASGGGSQILVLPGPIPITSVSSLVVDKVSWTVMNPGDAEADQYVWIPDHGRWIEARGTLVFPEGRGNVSCSRTAGYAANAMPADLQDAVAMLAVLLFQESDQRLGQDVRMLKGEVIERVKRNPKEYEFIARVIARYERKF